MKFDLKKPCDNCPFLRDNRAVRLKPVRAFQIGSQMLSWNGGSFACHKTTVCDEGGEEDGSRCETSETQHCAGALIFNIKNQADVQLLRLAEGVGLYDPRKFTELPLDEKVRLFARVFDSLEEMVDMNRKVEIAFLERAAKRKIGRRGSRHAP